MAVRVLICDGRPLVRDGLRSLLDAESDIEVVATADSAVHAMALVREHRPRVVITGLSPAGLTVAAFIARLLGEDADDEIGVVVYASADDDETVGEILHAGANALLTEEASREELALAVRAVASGHAMLGPRIAQRLIGWYRQRPERGALTVLDAELLTPREREILILTAEGQSTEDISRRLFIGVATVRTHIYRLRCKLHLRDRAQLVSYAYRAGLMRQ